MNLYLLETLNNNEIPIQSNENEISFNITPEEEEIISHTNQNDSFESSFI